MAAPSRPIDEIAPAIDRPAGAWMSFVSTRPSSPTRPGITWLTASMSACHATGFPESHSAAIENPSSTAANTAKSMR
jgi:hypothetical protein